MGRKRATCTATGLHVWLVICKCGWSATVRSPNDAPAVRRRHMKKVDWDEANHRVEIGGELGLRGE